VRLKDSVNDVNVIESADCSVNGCCVLGIVLDAVYRSNRVKQFVVRPRLLRE
jgi:hypothetical protein